MPNFKLLDVVSVANRRLVDGSIAADLGTIVEEFGDGTFLIEFCDDDGQTTAIVEAGPGDLSSPSRGDRAA